MIISKEALPNNANPYTDKGSELQPTDTSRVAGISIYKNKRLIALIPVNTFFGMYATT